MFARILGCGFSVNSNLRCLRNFWRRVICKVKIQLFVGILDCEFSVKPNLKVFARIFGCGFSVKSNLKPFARILGCGFSVKSKIKLFVGILGCGFSVKSKFSETQAPCGLNMDCPEGKNSPQKRKKLELFHRPAVHCQAVFRKEGCGNEAGKSFSALNFSMSETSSDGHCYALPYSPISDASFLIKYI
ncbi:MAG: hypothetical protein ACLTK0_06830 [Anaerovoracaceae bacterium]